MSYPAFARLFISVNAKLLLFTIPKGQAILSNPLTELNLKISFTPITPITITNTKNNTIHTQSLA
jgi:hypothetical protein